MDIESRVKDLEGKANTHGQTLATHTEQIKTLFNRQECLDEMVKAVTVLATKMDNVEAGQAKIQKSMEELKSIPAKRWDTIVTALITGVIGAVIGAVIGTLL